MRKHTPGPWATTKINSDNESEITGPDTERLGFPEHIALVNGGLPGSLDNAVLIAASPDLLSPLEAVVGVADRDTEEFNKAREAIAKATNTK